MVIVSIILCFFTISYAVVFFYSQKINQKDKQYLEEKLKDLFNSFNCLKNENEKLKKESEGLKEINENIKREKQDLEILNSKLNSELNSLKENQQKQEEWFKQQQENQKNIFQNLSNSTLEKQTEIGKQKIDELLKPFKNEIETCKRAIDEVNLKTKTEINANIENLIKKTEEVGKNANNLAKAFEGNKKIQGNWGEEQLVDLLRLNGISQFKTQITYTYDGKDYRPDLVVILPQDTETKNNRCFIIDSKVSLLNYMKYINCENQEEKKEAIKKYIDNIKDHIEELGKYRETFKKYLEKEKKGESLDFVCMFVPIEGAYMTAVMESKQEILSLAYKEKVAIVTPSSLMPILRMINHLWNIENSNKNINKIVEQVATLYEKLSKFCNYQNETHKFLLKAVECHKNSTKYLSDGRENVLRTAEKIKNLMNNKISTDINLFIQDGNDINNHEDSENIQTTNKNIKESEK